MQVCWLLYAQLPFSVSTKAKDMYVQCTVNTHNSLASKRPRLNLLCAVHFPLHLYTTSSTDMLVKGGMHSEHSAIWLPIRRHACSTDIHYKQSMYTATVNKSTRDVYFSNFLNSMPSGGFMRTVPLLTSSQLVLRTVPFDSTWEATNTDTTWGCAYRGEELLLYYTVGGT